MSSHARLSPSNLRWPVCPGSIYEEERYPDIAGEAAIDGTGTHLLLEMCVDNGVPAITYDMQTIGVNHEDNIGGWFVDLQRVQRVQICLDYIKRRFNELGEAYPLATITVEAESRSDPGGMFGRDDWHGTCDITITAMTGEECSFIEVIDYKDGRGFVNAKDNSQLIAYLGGKMRDHVASGIDKVRPFRPEKVSGCRATIVQPKTNPPIRYQCSTQPDDNFSPADVLDKLTVLSQAASATDEPAAQVRLGKHCQWCKANPKRGGHCTAAIKQSIEVIDMKPVEISNTSSMFELMTQVVEDPTQLKVSELSEMLSAKDALLAAFDKCETEIKLRIESGINVPGYAMQPGRVSRKWNITEEEVVKKLKSRRLKLDDIYPKKLISVAALMKLTNLTEPQKKKIEEDCVSEVAGKLTLKKVSHNVAQSDEEVLQSGQEMFKDVPAIEPSPISFM